MWGIAAFMRQNGSVMQALSPATEACRPARSAQKIRPDGGILDVPGASKTPINR